MKKEDKKNFNAKELTKEKLFSNNKEDLFRNNLYKKPQKKKLHLNKNNINKHISFLLRLSMILVSISFSNSRLRKLDKINEITITLKGMNTFQNIISNSIPPPDEVIINGEKKELALTNYLLPDSIINVTIRWNSVFPSCGYLFYNFDHLLSVDFSNFDSSKLNDMTSMFHGCRNLKSINFKNFDTSLVEKMYDVFYACDSLESLDLSNFNTSLVTTMANMFYNCTSLKTLDISNFETKSVENMENIFRNAESLVSLDLSNLDLSNVRYLSYGFYGCKSLIYLNLNINKEKENIQVQEIISNDLTDLIYCIDEVKSKKIIRSFQNINRNNDCNNECFTGVNKLIIEKKVCIDDCEKDDTYKYEYNNICYNSSQLEPENSEEKTEQAESSVIESSEVEESSQKTESSVIESNEVEESSQKTESSVKESNEVEESTQKTESPSIENSEVAESIQKTESSSIENSEEEESKQKTEISSIESSEVEESSQKSESFGIESSELEENSEKIGSPDKSENSDNINSENDKILENFSVKEFFKESLDIINVINEDITKKDEIIKSIKKELMSGNLDTLLINVTSGEKQDLIATDKNTIYQITTSENQKNNEYTNISTINLGKCEDRLKYIYGIDKNLSLLIFKIDYFEDGLKIPVIGYEIYHPLNKSQLDLKYCEEFLVKLDIPVSIDESVEFKHDPNSEYYNDECSTYTTENGTDILLDDRRNEYIDNNLSLCEANCTYKGYNEDTKKALCECETKAKIESISDIINNENILSNNFSTDNSTSNIGSLKCTKTLFTKEGLITNIGNYLLLFTFSFFIVSVVIFYKCGYHIIDTTIKEMLDLKTKEKRNSNPMDIFCKKKKRNNSTKKLKSKKKKIIKIQKFLIQKKKVVKKSQKILKMKNP